MQDKGPRPQGTLRAGQSRLPPLLRGVRQIRKKQPPVREQDFPPAFAHRRVRLVTFLPSLRPAVRKRSRCRLPALLSCRPHGGAWVIAVITNPVQYLLALAAGAVVGCLVLSLLKRPLPPEQSGLGK